MNTDLFGETRTVVKDRYALIAPDGHVPSKFPHWNGATGYVMLSPAIGSDLSQILITFDDDQGKAVFPKDKYEYILFVETGDVSISCEDQKTSLTKGGYFFSPPHHSLILEGNSSTRITVFRKVYEPLEDVSPPAAFSGNIADIEAKPFLGFQGAMLKTIIPEDDMSYDLAMNVFTYAPGATLPFVETHVMEHGMLILEGQGVYRLDQDHYPVKKGDAIWLGAYCPQWFVAMGESPASYLYYKNVNRLP